MKLIKVCDQVIIIAFKALFFITPLVVIPWTYELFEFNKMMLVYALTAIIAAAWLIKLLSLDSKKIKLTSLGLALLLFLGSQILSTIFSIQPYTSIWGYYSRFHGGLLSSVSYTLLYLALVNNLDQFQVKSLLKYLLASALLVSGYGIAERFGIDKDFWVQDVQNRVFSTLGQPNWLAGWLAAILPIALVKELNTKQQITSIPNKSQITKSKFKIPIYYILYTIYFVCLLFTKSRSGILAFGLSHLILVILLIVKREVKLKPLLALGAGVIILSLMIGTPWTPAVFQITNHKSPARQSLELKATAGGQITNQSVDPQPPLLISESGDIRQVVWQGALDVWRHWPWTGSGVETFAYSYYQFRPREHNDLSEWDFLYNKAHNEYLNFLATTGIIGLASYLLFVGASIWYMVYGVKKSQNTVLNTGLFTGWISILISNFFGFSTVPVALQFFLFPGLIYLLTTEIEADSEYKKSVKLLPVGLILVGLTLVLVRLVNLWRADYFFSQAKKMVEYEPLTAYELGQKAISLSPKQALFHSQLGEMAAQLSQVYYQQIRLTDNEANKLLFSQNQALAAEVAEVESQRALELNPAHLNLYKSRVKVLIALAKFEPELYQSAIEVLEQAIKLSPTDAKLYYNLALVYSLTDNSQLAIETMDKTVALKPNYGQARQALAQFYYQNQETAKAIEQLRYILDQINPYDENAIQLLDQWQ